MSDNMFPPAPPSSSPLSSAPASQRQDPITLSQQIDQWRLRRELPFEIQQFVRIYFEESLFTKALDFLLAIVTSDASSPRHKDVTVPPTEYLALAATLVVHPWLTTRTTSEEKWAEAGASLRLLRLLLKTAGPVSCRFNNAFRFKKLYDSKAAAVKDDGADNDDDDDDNGNNNDERLCDHQVRHPFADEDGIWNRADDFWAVVGWAMNCSCLPDMYASRAEHWQLWLDFMIDVLEQDWFYHVARQRPGRSMLWRYVGHGPGDNNNNHTRRIVRALFADGSKTSLNEFRQVFRHELKGPKKQDTDGNPKKREAVDIDNEIYGDYLAQDDSDDTSDGEVRTSNRTSTRALSARRITPRTSRQSLHSDLDEDSSLTSTRHGHGLGPPEAVTARLRLIQLLIYVASEPLVTARSQLTNFLDLTDLYTLLVEFIKSLPLLAFQQIISAPLFNQITSTSNLGLNTLTVQAHAMLLMFLLQRLLETPPPTFEATSTITLTQQRLQANYLPHAANKSTADANARASICVECLLRNLANARLLQNNRELAQAAERGIERRMGKVAKRKRDRGSGDGEEEREAMDLLVESSARIRGVLRRLAT